jgi:propanediol dehydratase small subunit
MTTKDLIIQALDEVPDYALLEILEYVRGQKAQHSEPLVRKEVWDAYQASVQEREEVYRRLADS